MLRAAGWGVVEGSKVHHALICPDHITGGGGRANPLSADYVLSYRDRKLVVIEANASTPQGAAIAGIDGLGVD